MLVSIKEFKAHFAQYIAQAQAGQPIELTSHRKIVARIIGVPEHSSKGMDNLLAAGVISWSGGKPEGANVVLSGGGKTLSDIVIEDRG